MTDYSGKINIIVRALEDGDLQTLFNQYTEDFTYYEPDYKVYFEEIIAATSNLRVESGETYLTTDKTHIVREYKLTTTYNSRLRWYPEDVIPDGRTIVSIGTSWYKIKEDKICELRRYGVYDWDGKLGLDKF